MQKRSSNTMKKQNNVDLFQSILCFALFLWFYYCCDSFYSRMCLLWAGITFWCTCYWKVNLEIEVEIIQWFFLVCRLVKMRLSVNIFWSFPAKKVLAIFYETNGISIMLPSELDWKRNRLLQKEGFYEGFLPKKITSKPSKRNS